MFLSTFVIFFVFLFVLIIHHFETFIKYVTNLIPLNFCLNQSIHLNSFFLCNNRVIMAHYCISDGGGQTFITNWTSQVFAHEAEWSHLYGWLGLPKCRTWRLFLLVSWSQFQLCFCMLRMFQIPVVSSRRSYFSQPRMYHICKFDNHFFFVFNQINHKTIQKDLAGGPMQPSAATFVLSELSELAG